MHPKGSNTRVLVGGPHAPMYICALWKFIPFLESRIVIFFLHKKFLALESFLHGGYAPVKFLFWKKFSFFLNAYFWSHIQPSNPYGMNLTPFFSWNFTLFSFLSTFWKKMWPKVQICVQHMFVSQIPKSHNFTTFCPEHVATTCSNCKMMHCCSNLCACMQMKRR